MDPWFNLGYMGTYCPLRQRGNGRFVTGPVPLNATRPTMVRMRRELRPRARQRVLAEHTPQVRAEASEGYVEEAISRRRGPSRMWAAGD